MTFTGKIADLLEQPGFRHFSNSMLVDLSYVDIANDPFPTPQEAEVWFEIGEKRQSAFVPLFCVDKDRKTAKAALIGEVGRGNPGVLSSYKFRPNQVLRLERGFGKNRC